MEPLLTALILPVPEAEPVVAADRARLDRAASWGVPAHVTVMFPSLPPERVDEPVRAALRVIAGRRVAGDGWATVEEFRLG